jgi:hypothetical protein
VTHDPFEQFMLHGPPWAGHVSAQLPSEHSMLHGGVLHLPEQLPFEHSHDPFGQLAGDFAMPPSVGSGT